MKKIISLVIVLSLLLVVASCGANDGGSAESEKPAPDSTEQEAEPVEEVVSMEKNFKVLAIWPESEVYGSLLTNMMEKYKTEVNPNFNYEYEIVSADNLKQKIATLAASNDLPDMFAYESGKPILELVEAGKIINISEALAAFDGEKYIEDGANSLLKTLSGTEDLYDLPLGLNMEGFWYNKALFQDAGVEPPTTWEEFEDVCAKLQAAGIQPLTTGGANGWPVTRLINAYVYRSMGVDAMAKAGSGEANYTDEGYVKAAQVIQDLANKEYFGQGIVTVDMGTAGTMLMAGKAAMLYNGSWFAADLNMDTNPAGMDGVGFFNVPVVDESISAMNEYSMNCGNILTLSADKYDDVTADFLKYFVENIGNYGMEEYGALLGYKFDVEPKLSPYTQIVAEELAKAEKSTTWFEAAMDTQTSKVAQKQIQTLINGEMTAEEYMNDIQDSHNMAN